MPADDGKYGGMMNLHNAKGYQSGSCIEMPKVYVSHFEGKIRHDGSSRPPRTSIAAVRRTLGTVLKIPWLCNNA